MSVDIGESTLTGMALIEACRDARYWCECTNCGTRIDEEMTDLYEFDEFEKDEVIERVLHPCCTIDGSVFCCRDCRGAEMQLRIAAAGRKQEQVRIARKVFGDDIQIVDVCGRSRSGFCRCRDKFGHGVEYPGLVGFHVPGLAFRPVTGCSFCRCWGVPRGDIESGAWARVCEERGITLEK